jgi:hypothetical protein
MQFIEQKGIMLKESQHKKFISEFIVELESNAGGKELTVLKTSGEDVEFMKDKKLQQLPKDPELNYLSARIDQTTFKKLELE